MRPAAGTVTGYPVGLSCLQMRVFRFYAAAAIVLGGLAAAQESPEPILKEAITLHQSGNVEKAIPQYRAYLKLRPENVDARSNLGAALASTGRYDEAITEYREALKGRPRDPRIWRNLALAYYKAGRISEAATELAALHKSQPADPQVTLLLADCWLRQGQDKQVIELLTPIATQRPDDLAVAYVLGSALVRDKQIERGQAMIDRIMRNGDSAEARLMLGTAKMGAMDYTGAITEFQKAVELNPNLPDVHAFLGVAQKESGDLEASRAEFQKEIQQNPNDFESNLNLAVLLKQDQEYEGARKLLDRALRVRPGHGSALCQLAAIELWTGKLEQARAGWNGISSRSRSFYRLKRKEDGDREKALVQKLTAERDGKDK